MKQLILILLSTAFSYNLSSQISFTAKYNSNTFSNWQEIVDEFDNSNMKFIGNGPEFGLAYWFRLKERRLEFNPEFFFNQQEAKTFSGIVGPDKEFNRQTIGFQFSTQIYPLDWEGDCNCPTFDKDGDFIAKGFFIGLAPGVTLNKLKHVSLSEEVESSAIALRVGAFAGLDIGILKWITISPTIQLNYSPAIQWDGLDTYFSDALPLDERTSTSLFTIQPGIRLSLRFDYLKEQNRFR